MSYRRPIRALVNLSSLSTQYKTYDHFMKWPTSLPHSTSTSPSKRICVGFIYDYLRANRIKRTWQTQKAPVTSLPLSQSLTLSLLHDVIGSMLGVLGTWIQLFPIEFFNRLYKGSEEGTIHLDNNDDDDDGHSHLQVNPQGTNSMKLSARDSDVHSFFTLSLERWEWSN